MDLGTFVVAFLLGFIASAVLLAGGMSMKVAEGERKAWAEAIGVFIRLQAEHTKWHEDERRQKMPDLTGPKRKAH